MMVLASARWEKRLARFVVPAAIAAVTLFVYAWRLGSAPRHLHYDEIFFALQGHSIATTGHDMNGRSWPLYFQLDATFNWYQPLAVYFTALWLKLLPVTDAAIRFPTVVVGVVDSVLMYFVGLRIFRRTDLAVAASAILATSPAHFIQSRVAMDYVYPLPFVLCWLVCFLIFLERQNPVWLFAATSSLGIGCFSYIASVVMMPVYLICTAGVLLFQRRSLSLTVIAVAGFVIPLIVAAPLFLRTPDAYSGLMKKYWPMTAGRTTLNPFQAARETVNYTSLTERVSLYYDFFNPAYLFLAGGTNLTNSTRRAGVFLYSLAFLLPLGAYTAIRRRSVIDVVLLIGFMTAPLAAITIDEPYTIDREMEVVVFGAILAVYGIEACARAKVDRTMASFVTVVAVVATAVSGGYGLFAGVMRGHLSASAIVATASGLAVIGVAQATIRLGDGRPLLLCLLLAIALQFVVFLRDYTTDYSSRAAAWFGGNIRGAVLSLIALDDRDGGPAVYISADIPYISSFWRWYLIGNRRLDLSQRTSFFDREQFSRLTMPQGSLVLGAANDDVLATAERTGALHVRKRITDANPADIGGGEHVDFVIYAK